MKLLACPFCGGNPRFYYRKERHYAYELADAELCCICGVQLKRASVGTGKASCKSREQMLTELTEAWNNRV